MKAQTPSSNKMASRQALTTGVSKATGRDRDEWFGLLDDWGAPGHGFREIADWLEHEHGLTAWWAQKLVVEYEQERGLRSPGIRPDGTFTVTATKTIGVPVHQAYAAFVDPAVRARWLPDLPLRERTATPVRSARFDVAQDTSRLGVSFTAKGDARSQVAIEHHRLADSDAAERAKSAWRDRLAALKALLEG